MENKQCLEAQVTVASEHALAGKFTAENPKSIQDSNRGAGGTGSTAFTNVGYDELVTSNPNGSVYGKNSSAVPLNTTSNPGAPFSSGNEGTIDNSAAGSGTSIFPTEHASLNGNINKMVPGLVTEQAYMRMLYIRLKIARTNCLDFSAWIALLSRQKKLLRYWACLEWFRLFARKSRKPFQALSFSQLFRVTTCGNQKSPVGSFYGFPQPPFQIAPSSPVLD